MRMSAVVAGRKRKQCVVGSVGNEARLWPCGTSTDALTTSDCLTHTTAACQIPHVREFIPRQLHLKSVICYFICKMAMWNFIMKESVLLPLYMEYL